MVLDIKWPLVFKESVYTAANIYTSAVMGLIGQIIFLE